MLFGIFRHCSRRICLVSDALPGWSERINSYGGRSHPYLARHWLFPEYSQPLQETLLWWYGENGYEQNYYRLEVFWELQDLPRSLDKPWVQIGRNFCYRELSNSASFNHATLLYFNDKGLCCNVYRVPEYIIDNWDEFSTGLVLKKEWTGRRSTFFPNDWDTSLWVE